MLQNSDCKPTVGILSIRIYNTCSGRASVTQRAAQTPTDAQTIYESFQPPLGWEKYGYRYETLRRQV